MDTIGERFTYIRKKILNISQKNFSIQLGISQGALSEIENGNRGIPMEACIRLLEYSKTDKSFSFEWLLTGKGQPDESEASKLAPDEEELLNSYRQLDNRGRHIIHAAIYQEIDRMNSTKSNI